MRVFFIFIFRYFCRSLFIMARFSNTRKLEMFYSNYFKICRRQNFFKSCIRDFPQLFSKG